MCKHLLVVIFLPSGSSMGRARAARTPPWRASASARAVRAQRRTLWRAGARCVGTRGECCALWHGVGASCPHVPPGTATSSLTAAHLQAERIASSSMCVAAMKRRRGPTFDSRARVRFGGTTGTPFLPSRVKAASRTGTCTAAHARTRASSVTSAAAMRPARCARRVAACLGSKTPREHRYW